jgi:hypothetical protein
VDDVGDDGDGHLGTGGTVIGHAPGCRERGGAPDHTGTTQRAGAAAGLAFLLDGSTAQQQPAPGRQHGEQDEPHHVGDSEPRVECLGQQRRPAHRSDRQCRDVRTVEQQTGDGSAGEPDDAVPEQPHRARITPSGGPADHQEVRRADAQRQADERRNPSHTRQYADQRDSLAFAYRGSPRRALCRPGARGRSLWISARRRRIADRERERAPYRMRIARRHLPDHGVDAVGKLATDRHQDGRGVAGRMRQRTRAHRLAAGIQDLHRPEPEVDGFGERQLHLRWRRREALTVGRFGRHQLGMRKRLARSGEQDEPGGDQGSREYDSTADQVTIPQRRAFAGSSVLVASVLVASAPFDADDDV